MDLRPFALVLALIAPAAYAGSGCGDDPSYGAGCGGNYPAPPKRGTRTEVYLHNNGYVETYRSDALFEEDEIAVYDYESGDLLDEDELEDEDW